MTVYAPSKDVEILRLEDIPLGTTKLDLNRCHSLIELPKNLPEGLLELDIDWCRKLEKLPPFPKSLNKFTASHCSEIKKLPDLPEGLTELEISWCYSFKKLPPLPEGLTKLFARSCLKLARLPDLPKGLTELAISGCELFEEFPELPQGLIKLMVSNLSNQARLRDLLERITELHISELHISGYEFEELPNLPESLTKFTAYNCSEIKKLPDLPEWLTELEISWCESLEELPELPESLTKLIAKSCSNLARLPENFPANLEYLDLSDCSSLPNSPALITQLRELENRNRDNPNFELIWPVHIDQTAGKATEVKQLITGAYKQYYSTNPDFRDREPNATDGANYPTLKLFHRFLSESVGDRGGAEKIAESAFITAQKIAQNPQLFKFIDEHSKTYLDACVNQPVAGFTEISMMVDITTQLDVRSKLEAARMLMSVEVIRETTSKLIKNATGVEAELANAMLIEVCKELRVEWPGVPQGIAYEGAISSFLTRENIRFVAGEVLKVWNKPFEDMAEYMCEHGQQDFWADITLTEEEKDSINQPLKILKERFLEEEDPSELASLETKIKDSETACRGAILLASKGKTLLSLRTPVAGELQEKEEDGSETLIPDFFYDTDSQEENAPESALQPRANAQNPTASQFEEDTTHPFQRNL